MPKRISLRRIRFSKPSDFVFCGTLLVSCFLAGALGGYVYSISVEENVQAVLSEYLKDFCYLLDSGVFEIPLARCAAVFFSYSAAVLAASFSSLGVILIPLISGTFGFGVMYTINCFVLTFGRSGILPALALLAPRLLTMLPCFLAIGIEAWKISANLASISTGHSSGRNPTAYRNHLYAVLLLCCFFLLLGVCCEQLLTPRLFHIAIKKLL